MAVVATMLAGLASSEMTRAQYDRSLAAQQQSKAGDQWSFFQAKRLRGAYQRNTADLVQNLTEVHQVDGAAIKAFAQQAPGESKAKTDLVALLDSPAGQQAAMLLQKASCRRRRKKRESRRTSKRRWMLWRSFDSDADVAAALASVSVKDLDDAVRAARERVQAFDTAATPANQAMDRLENLLSQVAAAGRRTREFGISEPRSDGRSFEICGAQV